MDRKSILLKSALIDPEQTLLLRVLLRLLMSDKTYK